MCSLKNFVELFKRNSTKVEKEMYGNGNGIRSKKNTVRYYFLKIYSLYPEKNL